MLIATIAFAGVDARQPRVQHVHRGPRPAAPGRPVSLLGIGIPSPVAIVLAVLNLVLDFDYIEQGVRIGAPASESWRGAFGLTVTMVWLYIELLHLLSLAPAE